MVNTRIEGKVEALEKEVGGIRDELGTVKDIIQLVRESMARLENAGREKGEG